MKLKRITALLLGLAMTAGIMTGCQNGGDASSQTAGGESKTLKVAALESAYGADVWKEIAAAFEEENEGVTVELTIDKNLEDIIGAQMKAKSYPDFVHLAVGRPAGLTETMIKENALTNLEDVLNMQIPGESVTVQEKLLPGFTDTLVTNPYSDGETYLAPMFYGPCGLFYNAGLFEEKGWEVPTTWDEMWELGDKAAAEGISLFTYPTAGYFDAFFYALMNSVGGPDFFNKAMNYEDGIWETPEATKCFEIVGKLATYTEKTTVANANNDNYLKNQQLVCDNKALFMPNGSWVTEEMIDAPKADGFEWGFTALPAVEKDGDRYSYTFFEQSWIPSAAKNPELAKEFMAFLYSDKAADIFLAHGAAQPIKGVADKMGTDKAGVDKKLIYGIYDNGATAAMGSFAATEPVEGVEMFKVLFESVNSIVSGDKTVAEWQADVEKASDALRDAKK